MYNYFVGKIKKFGNKTYLINQNIGIEITYLGEKIDGEFFLSYIIDDNKRVVNYYCFDNFKKKDVFDEVLKISGIGPKTAIYISELPQEQLKKAIKDLDTNYFQSIPGIGPKSSKKLLISLKETIQLEDLQKIDINNKLLKDVVNSLKNFGYDSTTIKEVLKKYPNKIDKNNISEVIKRVISQINK